MTSRYIVFGLKCAGFAGCAGGYHQLTYDSIGFFLFSLKSSEVLFLVFFCWKVKEYRKFIKRQLFKELLEVEPLIPNII